jgi:hypothetical protein
MLTIGAVGNASAAGWIALPVSADDAPGAYGSRWTTVHQLRNVGENPIEYLHAPCVLSPCDWLVIQPNRTVTIPGDNSFGYVGIDVARGEDVQHLVTSTVLMETSGGSPLAKEQLRSFRMPDMRVSAQVLNIPVSFDRRITVRLFRSGPTPLTKTTLRFFRPATNRPEQSTEQVADELLTELTVDMYWRLRVDDVVAIAPERASVDAFRLEVVEQGGGGSKYWVLVTSTDNVTNDVDAFYPDP